MKYSYLLLIVIILAPRVVYADDGIERVVITTSRLDKPVLPINVSLLTREDILHNTSDTLSDLLQQQAGAQVIDFFGQQTNQGAIDLRGFGSTGAQNTLLVWNGQRLNDLDLSAVDLSAIPMQAIERIEIMRGSGHILYGSGGVGGVIHIMTLPSAKTPSTIQFSQSSYETYSGQAHGSFKISDHAHTAGLQIHRSAGYRQHNHAEQAQAYWQTAYAIGHNLEVSHYFFVDKQTIELPGPRLARNAKGINEINDDPRGTATPFDDLKKTGAHALLNLRKATSNGVWHGDIALKRKQQIAFFDDYLTPDKAFSRHLDSTLQTLSLNPRYIGHSAMLGIATEYQTGLDVDITDYHSDRSLRADTRPIHKLTAHLMSTEWFHQHELTFNEQHAMTLGVRLSQQFLRANDAFDPRAEGAPTQGQAAAALRQRQTQPLWLWVWHYKPTGQRWQTYLQLNRTVRYATIDELFQFQADQAQFTLLQPQTAHLIETGVGYQASNFSMKLSVYQQTVDNEIHFNPVDFTNRNLDRTQRRGIELSSTWQLHPQWQAKVEASLIDARFRAGPFAGNTVPLVAKQQAYAALAWQPDERWSMIVSAHYKGKRRFDNDESNSFEQLLPSRTIWDSKLRYHRPPWTWTASLHNLSNQRYVDYGIRSLFSDNFSAFPLPERQFSWQISWQA